MKRMAAILLSLCMLGLTGCLKAHSLEHYGYVIALGFDRGEKLPYNVTLMLQNMQMEEGSQKNAGFTLVSAECRGLFEAINTLSARLPFTLDFSRTMILVFAQELVREEGVLKELLSMSFPELHIRYNANVYVALDKAADVFEGMKNEMEPNLSRIQKNYQLYAESTGFVPVSNLTLFSEAIEQKYEDAVLPLCGKGEEDSEPLSGDSVGENEYPYLGGTLLVDSEMKTGLAGAAIFAGDRMVGLLDGENTQLLLMVLGEFRQGHIRMETERGESSLLVSAPVQPQIRLRLGDKPEASVVIRLHASLEQPEDVDEEEMKRMGEQLTAQLETGLARLLRACQGCGSDAMGFGRFAVKRFSSAEDWAAYDWRAAYRSLGVAFEVQLEMERLVGSTIQE